MARRGWEIARGLAYALLHLHGIGVVHLNLTLENVMLDHRMRAKAADFSRARMLPAYAACGPVQYAACGPVQYATPEVYPEGLEVPTRSRPPVCAVPVNVIPNWFCCLLASCSAFSSCLLVLPSSYAFSSCLLLRSSWQL